MAIKVLIVSVATLQDPGEHDWNCRQYILEQTDGTNVTVDYHVSDGGTGWTKSITVQEENKQMKEVVTPTTTENKDASTFNFKETIT